LILAVYVVTGKLGSGKGIVSLSRIYDYLWRGRVVATNLDLNLRHLVGRNDRKCRVIRLPDHPKPSDLNSLPNPNTSYDEGQNGLLCLDECATWLNSHDFRDKTRPEFLNWLLHSRKKGWDVILQIQDFESLDAQIRRSLAEHVVYCRRTDRLPIPVLGVLLSGILKLPKFHIGFIRYGDRPGAPLVGTWTTRGSRFYLAYDTKQIFDPCYPHGVHSVLPPGYINFGRVKLWDWAKKMRLTKIILRRYDRVLTFTVGVIIAASLCLYMVPYRVRDSTASSEMWKAIAALARVSRPERIREFLYSKPSSCSDSSSSFSPVVHGDIQPAVYYENINKSYVQVDDKIYSLGSHGIQVARTD